MLDEEDDEPVELEKPKAPEPVKDPEVTVILTTEEKMMATEIEDISEDLHAEQVVSNRQGAGKTSIAFMDPSSMSGIQIALYLLFFVGFFVGVGYYFYSQLFNTEVDPRKLKRQALNDKRKENPELYKQKNSNKKKR